MDLIPLLLFVSVGSQQLVYSLPLVKEEYWSPDKSWHVTVAYRESFERIPEMSGNTRQVGTTEATAPSSDFKASPQGPHVTQNEDLTTGAQARRALPKNITATNDQEYWSPDGEWHVIVSYDCVDEVELETVSKTPELRTSEAEGETVLPELSPETEKTTLGDSETTTTHNDRNISLPPTTAPQVTETTRNQRECSIDNCKPPQCTCMSQSPPAGLRADDIPQFVVLTFDGAVNATNMPFYRELLGGLKRRNKASDCAIAATFFVSADHLDYVLVNELYAEGNEIALHSISHHADQAYWNEMDTPGWELEVVDEMKMVETFANIPASAIKGFRGPFLLTGGDQGFRMIHSNFWYDSSLVHPRNDDPDALPTFPYTLDFGFKDKCVVELCPQDSYPGLWVMPLNALFKRSNVDGVSKKVRCSMADACEPQPSSANETWEYLRSNFEDFYRSNRAPFPVSLHEAWLQDPQRKEGYLRFVDWLLENDDVHLVTVSEVLDFMKNPTSKSSYAQRRCMTSKPESTCPTPKSCEYSNTPAGGPRNMRVCTAECPPNYPWLFSPLGNEA